MGIMYYVMSFMKGNKKAVSNNPIENCSPTFPKGSFLDMYCFLSEAPVIRVYEMTDLIWSETGIALGLPFPDTRNYTYTYEPSVVGILPVSSLCLRRTSPPVCPEAA